MEHNQIYVDLSVNANVQQAQQNLQTLKTTLNQIASVPMTFGDKTSVQLKEAAAAAKQLQGHLSAAMDVNTGNLNLTKFQASLKSSNTDLTMLTSNLLKAGMTGEQAFLATHSAISQASIKINQTNTALTRLATTLKNTIRWQISASLIQGFVQGVTEAVDYTKDLDESLNNIRIVTKMSSSEMANFAKQANKTAKELKTTTTAYTDAALIYYQQGLSGKEVEERTNATIKLANVTGKTAEIVSEQLTAIWNNFDDGSKSLEYYVDVVTALGAATASSSDEIATGLEKFAAVAETVGLSYEYATTALATVTAETRQSADVVGTAFKTLFARIQDLELGETLDDGVTLGKYSQALQTVGVSVVDANGNLREMNNILDDLGTRWNTISSAEQVALAQTVAGMRQYNQFLALMSNWDKFQVNLEVAENSEGELTKQAAIYEQSWEAAQKNVTASAESIYNALIPKDALIDMTNGFADVLEFIGKLLDSFGGFQTILLAISNIALTKFQPQIANAIDTGIVKMGEFAIQTKRTFSMIKENGFGEVLNKITQPFKDAITGISAYRDTSYRVPAGSPEAAERSEKLDKAQNALYNTNARGINKQTELQRQVSDSLNEGLKDPYVTASFKEQISGQTKINDLNTQLINLKGKMSAQEQQIASTQLEELRVLNEQKSAQTKITEEVSARRAMLQSEMSINFSEENYSRVNDHKWGSYVALNGGAQGSVTNDALAAEAFKQTAKTLVPTGGVRANLEQGQLEFKDTETAALAQEEMVTKLGQTYELHEQIRHSVDLQKNSGQDMTEQITEYINKAEKNKVISKSVADLFRQQISDGKALVSSTNKYARSMKDVAKSAGITEAQNEAILKGSQEKVAAEQKNLQLAGQFEQKSNQIKDKISKVVSGATSLGNGFVKGIQGASQFAMGLNMVSSALSDIGENGASLQNISSLLMGMSTFLPATINLLKMAGSAYSNLATNIALSNALKDKQVVTDTILNLLGEKKLLNMKEEELQAFKLNVAKALGISTDQAGILVDKIKIALTKAKTAGEEAETSAIIAQTIAEYASIPPLLIIMAIVIALIAVILIIVSAISAWNKQLEANRQAQAETAKQNIESINANQELASSVSDLTEEYKKLQEQGESTYETMQELKEQIPDLIDNYRKLEGQLGIDLGLDKLEAAYKYFEATGDIDPFTEAQEETDKKVLEAEKQSAQSGGTATRQLMFGDSPIYNPRLGGTSSDRETELLKDVMGDFLDPTNSKWIKADVSSNADALELYQAMGQYLAQAETKFSAEELARSNAYKGIKQRYAEMAEYAEQFEGFNTEQFNIAQKDFVEEDGDQELFKQFDIKTLDEYKKQRDSLIEKLKQEHDITTKQAEQLLSQSDAFSNFEIGFNLFSTDPEDPGKIADQLKYNASLSINEVQAWFDSLPENEKTLAMSLQYDQAGSIEELNAQMAEKLKEAERAKVKKAATDAGIDTELLETYSGILSLTNEQLEANDALTDQIALNNLKMNKGLKTLNETWEKNYDILKAQNTATPEYAEAMTKVASALEDTFGVKPSSSFIQQNLEDIKRLAVGDTSALQDLQDKMAEDYVAQMEILLPTNENGGIQDIVSAKEKLAQMLEGLDTSLEVGQGATISDDYWNMIQEMLDAGQMTEEQLEGMFRAKGFEYNVTGYKKVPGPKKTITQTIKGGGFLGLSDKTIVTEEQEEIEVPIVNGDASGISSGTASTATLIRSTDASSIDFSSTKEGKEASGDFDPKDLDDERERYHEINKELKIYQNNIKNIDILEENTYGAAKLHYMDQRIEQLKKENDALERRNQEIKDYLALDKGTAAAYGAQFDENGNITNYEELIEQWVNEYNASGGSKAASKLYEDRKAALDQYEKTLQEFYDSENAMLEKHYEIISEELEKIDTKVKQSVELAKFEIKILDHQIKKLEDTAFDSAEAIALLGKKADSTVKQFEATKEGLAETLKVAGFTEDEIARALSGDIDFTDKKITQDLMDQLEYYAEQMLDYDATLAEVAKTVREELLTAFEEANEEFEKSAELVDYNTQMLENYQNIIDIVGKDTLGISDDVLEQMDKAKVAAANSMVQIRKAQAETNRANYEKMLAEYGDDPAWKEQIEKARSIWQESELAFQESFAESLEASAQAFENAVSRVMETYDEAMGGIAGSLQALTEQFERQSELADFYLKDYEKTYEINKLNRQVMQSIDKIDNVKNQRILRDLQSEILSYQTLGKEMSDYDLQYLQKKYDLLVAQIALEESQNAKSQVRLTRDSMGNFGYIYTADQNAVDQAQQTYEDKLYELLQWQDTSINELSGQLLEIQQAYRDAIESLDKDAADYELRVQEITDHYMAMAIMVTGELGDMMVYGKAINDEYGTHAKETFAETLLGNMYTDYTTFEELAEGITAAMQDSVDAIIDKHIEYAETVEEQFDNAGLDFENFGKKVEEETLKITEDVESIGTAAEEMAGDMKIQFGNAFNVVQGFFNQIDPLTKNIRTAIDRITGGLKDAMDAYDAFVNKTKEPEIPAVPGEGKNLTGGTGGLSNLGDLRQQEYSLPEYANNGMFNLGTRVKDVHGEKYWYIGKDLFTEEEIKKANPSLAKQYGGVANAAHNSMKVNKPETTTQQQKGRQTLVSNKQTVTDSQGTKHTVSFLEPMTLQQYNTMGHDPWVEKAVTIKVNGITYIAPSGSGGELWYSEKDVEFTKSNLDGYYTFQRISRDQNIPVYTLNKDYSFDTGGYTGSWGPEGRLAMLHQKEIVLNAHDTKNLLDTVSIVRSIVDQIELSALASQQGIGILRAAAVNNTTDTIQQNVTIEAHFPNATDHNEIEQAFNNLVNDAAQYANRKE